MMGGLLTPCSSKGILNEIKYMRAILVVLLVFYHSFIIYNSGWERIAQLSTNEYYRWLDKLSYSFLLEGYFFLSGYLFGHQTIYGKQLNLTVFVKRKFSRLMIPSLFFSIIYYFLFINDTPFNGWTFIYDIICGCGHLWFLPVLFLCFILAIFINKVVDFHKRRCEYVLIGCFILYIVATPVLMFRIGYVMQYFIFFMIGSYLAKKRDIIIRKSKYWQVLVLFLIFALLFFLFSIVNSVNDQSESSFYIKAFVGLVKKIIRFLYSTSGIFALFLCCVCVPNAKPNQPVDLVAYYSMGIYVFQEFILKGLYYYTPYCSVVHPLLIPWCAFIMSFLGSYIISVVFKKIKIIQNLI